MAFHRASGAQRARRSAFVEHLLAGMRALEITEQIARVHADIWAQLAAQGEVIGGARPLDRSHRARTRNGTRHRKYPRVQPRPRPTTDRTARLASPRSRALHVSRARAVICVGGRKQVWLTRTHPELVPFWYE